MFRADLKSLLDLTYCVEGSLLVRKRLQCGKLSIILCCELHNGILTIHQAKRVSLRYSGKRSRGKRSSGKGSRGKQKRNSMLPIEKSSVSTVDFFTDRSSQTYLVERIVIPPRFIDSDCQTQQVEHCQVSVDTLDLALHISRHQQTAIKLLMTTSSQTKIPKLEVRSTQLELITKSRWTQTDAVPCVTKVDSTQTLDMAPQRNSYAQTTWAEDEEELLRPYDSRLNLILKSLTCQSQLLFRAVESITQLLEFKQLELQKQSIQDEIGHTVANKEIETEAEVQKLLKLLDDRAKKAHRLCKHRCCLRTNCSKIRSKPTVAMKKKPEAQTQTQLPTTDWKHSQTDDTLETKVARFEVGIQTDKVKAPGLRVSWLRNSS